MSRESLIAGELQDLATAVSEVREQIERARADQAEVSGRTFAFKVPDPVINVKASDVIAPAVNVEVAAPIVNVAAPEVTVQSQVNVPEMKPYAYQVQVTKRDKDGLIQEFVIVPFEV